MMRWLRAGTLLLGLWLAAAPACAEALFVRAGRLVDVVQGRVLTDQLVRIEDGADASSVAGALDVPGETRSIADTLRWPSVGPFTDWTAEAWNCSPDLTPLLLALTTSESRLDAGANVQFWLSLEPNGTMTEAWVGTVDSARDFGYRAQLRMQY